MIKLFRRDRDSGDTDDLQAYGDPQMSRLLRTGYSAGRVPPDLMTRVGAAVHAARAESNKRNWGSGWSWREAGLMLGPAACALVIAGGLAVGQNLGSHGTSFGQVAGPVRSASSQDRGGYKEARQSGRYLRADVSAMLAAHSSKVQRVVVRYRAHGMTQGAAGFLLAAPRLYWHGRRLTRVRCSNVGREGQSGARSMCFALNGHKRRGSIRRVRLVAGAVPEREHPRMSFNHHEAAHVAAVPSPFTVADGPLFYYVVSNAYTASMAKNRRRAPLLDLKLRLPSRIFFGAAGLRQSLSGGEGTTKKK